ncbi:MAG: YIP1 family protein [Archaeoglobaceae archaeon]|nr:YIP1 family protein [Archaeoglobaceae archaeon]
MDFLLNPDKFFSEHKAVGFKIPIAIVSISAIISLFVALFSLELVLKIALDEMREQGISETQIETFKPVISATTIGGAFLFVFIGWLTITAILYVLSAIFKGEGNFAILMKFVAFSYIPVILLSPITLYLSYESFVMRNVEAFRVSIFFGMVIYVWQSIYWVFALKNARGISIKHSIVISCIILAFFLGSSIYTLLQPSILDLLRQKA